MCTNGSQLWYDNHKAFFWILVTISALIALAGVFGNALVIFAAMQKSHIGSSFRYLNRVVLSLAISDFAYSLLGEPFFVVHWYWGQTDIGPDFRNSGRTWVMSIITFPLDVFSGASCYLVALVILLRCLALWKPMEFDEWHSKFTRIAIPSIWSFVVLIVLIPTAICTKMFTTGIMPNSYKHLYGLGWNIVYVTTITFPVGLITTLYFVQLCIVKPANNEEENHAKAVKRKAFEKMIHMVTIGTFLCYAPFIVWRHMLIASITRECSQEAYDSTGKVLYAFIVRMSVQFGCIVNPLIYATTIPGFKRMIKMYLGYCSRKNNVEDRKLMELNHSSTINSK